MQKQKSKINDYKTASEKIFGSPWQLVMWGLAVHLAAILTQVLMPNHSPSYIFCVWLFVFFICTIHDGITAGRFKENPGHSADIKTYVFRLWLLQSLIVTTGAILSVVLIYLGVYDYLPGLWLFFISLVLLPHIIIGQRKALLPFTILLVLGGFAAITFLIPYALSVFSLCFGVGGLVFGIYFLIARQFGEK
ncbi:hypothetical protein JW935_20965 [candidate division KSB1 bacterium]|nr:hypothetical protein [candidate division KSB1 bacterium]